MVFQYNPSCMNMTDVIIVYLKRHKETQNLSKRPQIVIHPSTLQSAKKFPAHSANSWTAVQPVHSILTITNLQLGSCLYVFYWPKSPQREDSQGDCAHIAKSQPHQQHRFANDRERDEEHGFRWLSGNAGIWKSSFECFVSDFWKPDLIVRMFLGFWRHFSASPSDSSLKWSILSSAASGRMSSTQS